MSDLVAALLGQAREALADAAYLLDAGRVRAAINRAYYAAFNAPPVNQVAQEAVTEPYLQDILKAYNSAPYVSQWLDTVYGLNVGNALNVGVVDLLAGKSDPKQLVEAVNAAAKKA